MHTTQFAPGKNEERKKKKKINKEKKINQV